MSGSVIARPRESMLTRNLRKMQHDQKEQSVTDTQFDKEPNSEKKDNDFAYPTVLRSGWLYRRPQKRRWLSLGDDQLAWKRRWFVLRDDQLTFYKDEQEFKAEGIISTADIMSAVIVKDSTTTPIQNSTKFSIFTSGETLDLRADNSVDAHSWLDMLRHAASQNSMVSSYKREELLSKYGEGSLPHNPVTSSTPNHQDTHHNQHQLQHHPGSIASGGVSFPNEFERSTSPSVFSASLENFSASNPSEDFLPIPKNQDQQTQEQNIQQGYLFRLKRHYKKWIRQYVVLTSQRVFFYKNKGDATPLKVLNVKDIADVLEIDPVTKSRLYCILMITLEKQIKFSCENEDDLTQWLASFKLAGIGEAT